MLDWANTFKIEKVVDNVFHTAIDYAIGNFKK